VKFTFLLTLGVLGASLCPASPLDVYARSIRLLGGNVVDPMVYPENVNGFQAFLKASAVNGISAADLTRPNHPEVATRLGFPTFLPPRSWWPRGAALALLTQSIETRIGAAVHVRNWWRPPAYNTDPAVGGAKNGDHPTANAVDLDYPSVAARMSAELYLRSLEKTAPWMQLSLGLGAQTTHIGLDSPRGHREWHYAGWRPAAS
jgi:hypothetical protein